jgi:5-methylcytosine-specific restriction endonuclease McrA
MRTKNARAIDEIEAAYMADVKRVPLVGWFAQRFIEYPARTRVDCIACGRSMWFPKCKAHLYKTCGDECAKRKFELVKNARKRKCEICGKEFVPRSTQLRNGQGKLCSSKCRSVALLPLLQTPEASAKAVATMAEMRKRGEIKYLRGPDSPCWTGGKKAARLRRIPKHKEYVKKNADRVRAWVHNRRVRKQALGKLPTNTVAMLKKLQCGKCAICRKKLGEGRECHLDHIVPLARNGRNEFHNVQLLCRQCNTHKSAKVPHVFMQSRGFLL